MGLINTPEDFHLSGVAMGTLCAPWFAVSAV
jgi:hypothetical protein